MVQDPNGMIVSAYDGDTTNNEWCPTRSTSNIVVGVVSSGSLIYLTITKSDIPFSVHTISKLMQFPWHLHLSAIHRIIKDLLGTSNRGLFFPTDASTQLQAYTDSD